MLCAKGAMTISKVASVSSSTGIRKLATAATVTPSTSSPFVIPPALWGAPTDYNNEERYWAKIQTWSKTPASDFLSHQWQVRHGRILRDAATLTR
jgi:hypothetical protein